MNGDLKDAMADIAELAKTIETITRQAGDLFDEVMTLERKKSREITKKWDTFNTKKGGS